MFLILPLQSVIGTNTNNIYVKETLICRSHVNQDITELIKKVNQSTLRNYIEKFVSFGFKKAESQNASNAAIWIKSEFEEMGLFNYFDNWKFPRFKSKNVVAVHNGSNPDSDAVIIICAHYDTTGGSPGAIDDGTGIALMLTIANITKSASFNHTIRFVATACEEVGCYGSFADAKKAYWENENIYAVLNIDAIGFDNYSEKGNILQIMGRDRSKWIIDLSKEISQKYNQLFDIIIQHGGSYYADDKSYIDFGFDAIQYVQTKPEDAHKNPFHTPNDTIDKVNFSYLENSTKLILVVTCELASNPIEFQVRIINPYEGCMQIKNVSIKLPCFNNYLTRKRAITYIIGKPTVKVNISGIDKINSVYFCIDGYIKHTDNEPPYEYQIGKGWLETYRLKGHHRLSVCVTTNTGTTVYDEMDIYVLTII